MFKGKNILCIIPARKNSKGIKNKNIKNINNKPLIFYPINSSINSKYVDKTIFSSDAENFKRLAKKFGAEAPFLRSKKLSSDTASTFDVIKDVLLKIHKKKVIYDIIVLLEPTSPLTSSQDIDRAIELLINKKFKSLVSITECLKYSIDFQFNKQKTNLINPIKLKNVNKRRQEVKKNYVLDGSIYISLTKELLKNKGFISNKTYGYELPKWKSLEIDDQNDLMLARLIYKIKNKKNDKI